MDSISQLFDKFAVAYQHSLYAIEQEESKANKKRMDGRANVKKRYERERSISATALANNLMASLHKLNEICSKMSENDDTVVRVAEYLTYGKINIDDLKKMIFSDTSIPCIIPFIGHGNVMLESNGDECHTIGLQFALQALQQTAPGQLSITVINPELRPEFSAFTRMPEFQMLTKGSEISDFFASITEELVEIDSLLQGRYKSLVGLRKAAQQPVGRLRLIVIQDLPPASEGDIRNQIIRVMKGAPRAGITILFLSNKNMSIDNATMKTIISISNFTSFKLSGNKWGTNAFGFENFSYEFPVKTGAVIAEEVSGIIEAAKKSSVITIPFEQIEGSERMWNEDSTENIIFNLGKSGLDTVSVCIGDKVTQHHNILISGAVGKGKSNLLEVMIHSLCWRYSPKELELYLLDFKDGLTFKPYSDKEGKSWLPHAKMLGLESDRDVGLAVLKDLENERLHRAELFRSAPDGGAKGYEEYRKKFPKEILPRVVLVIDEYQKLFETNDDISEEAAALLENLVRQGRACAIHVVLASQSINGAAGLLGKDERIYAQFPVRIALQNTISESYALFGIGNDAAAQLRVRGEAVMNENYGDVDSNQKFTVAYADPKDTKKIRQNFCKEYEKQYPVIFTRQNYMDFTMVMPEVKRWRRAVEDTGVVHIPLGVRLSVKRDVISLPFMNEIGKNIAILGSAENLHGKGVVPGQNNMAIGMVQGICLSLALQHPEGDARFVFIDGLGQDVSRNSNIRRWSQLMERFGFPIEFIGSNEAVDWLSGFRQELNDFGPDEDTYIICLGMDRYSNFSEMNLCGESGADTFQQLLKCGTQRVHFICWWSSVSTYKNHIGFGNDGYFETKVLLRMDTNTSRDVLGPFITWSVRENRAYIHDNSELPSDEVVIPLMPVNNRICGIVESEGW
jgi:hypothetical protein